MRIKLRTVPHFGHKLGPHNCRKLCFRAIFRGPQAGPRPILESYNLPHFQLFQTGIRARTALIRGPDGPTILSFRLKMRPFELKCRPIIRSRTFFGGAAPSGPMVRASGPHVRTKWFHHLGFCGPKGRGRGVRGEGLRPSPRPHRPKGDEVPAERGPLRGPRSAGAVLKNRRLRRRFFRTACIKRAAPPPVLCTGSEAPGAGRSPA